MKPMEIPASAATLMVLNEDMVLVETNDMKGDLDYPYVITLWNTYFDEDLASEARAILIPVERVGYQIPRYWSGLYRAEIRSFDSLVHKVDAKRRARMVLMGRLTSKEVLNDD